jgi:hypothetical protein
MGLRSESTQKKSESRVRAGVGVKGDIVISWMWRQHVYVIQSSKGIRTRGMKVSNKPSTNSYPEIVTTPNPNDLTSRSPCLMRSMEVLPARARKKAPMNGRIKVLRSGIRRRIRRTTERRIAKTVVLSVNEKTERRTAETSAVGIWVARVSRSGYFKSLLNMQSSVRQMKTNRSSSRKSADGKPVSKSISGRIDAHERKLAQQEK